MGDQWGIGDFKEGATLILSKSSKKKKSLKKIWKSAEIEKKNWKKKSEKSDIFFYWKWSKMH